MSFLNAIASSESIDSYKLSEKMKTAVSYNDFFYYWREKLFERLFRLFIWENTENVKPKEIEQRLYLAGHCGLAIPKEGGDRIKKELTAFFGSFFGVTIYQDEWTNYNVHSPIYSDTFTLDEDIVVINNNSLRNPTFDHVIHYAQLLAHAEVTLINILIEARDAGGVPIAKNEKAKQSLLSYQAKRYNGKIGVVSDLAGIGVEYMGSDRHTIQSIDEVWDVRTKLLKSFYADLGVRATFDKRSNTVVEEITSDSSMLMYNISDMLNERQEGCERVNKMFGTNWSVRLSDDIDYNEENQLEEATQSGGVTDDIL